MAKEAEHGSIKFRVETLLILWKLVAGPEKHAFIDELYERKQTLRVDPLLDVIDRVSANKDEANT